MNNPQQPHDTQETLVNPQQPHDTQEEETNMEIDHEEETDMDLQNLENVADSERREVEELKMEGRKREDQGTKTKISKIVFYIHITHS